MAFSAFIFDWFFFILAGNEDNSKDVDEFEIWPDLIRYCEVTCPLGSEKIPIDLLWKKCCSHSSDFMFDWIFFILAGYKDMLKCLAEFQTDSTTDF